jgi:hypothetical protein
MIVDEDILDLIRALPNEINDSGTTTEMKFLTVGGVLWACHDEIKKLREENERLRNESKSTKKVHRVRKEVR